MHQPIIGFEIHVELATQSKMFCGCAADFFGKEPNSLTCPVCLGLPGALPVPNKKAIDWTTMLGLALNCDIAKHSKFDRKHYFYPDLPKGYQISQYDEPLCTNGYIETSLGRVGITRVHLEEDTGKLQHTSLKGEKVSLVDFNRSGVPLVEIVTEPDIRSSNQAIEYAKKLHQIIRFLEISDADMEKGSMRLEANISLAKQPADTDKLELPNYKVEVKNVNSFRYIKAAIEYELQRHQKLLEKGKTPTQETRGYNERKNKTVSQRTKEEAADYRYFPEPDIPPLEFSAEDIQSIAKSMPPLPSEVSQILSDTYNIRGDYIAVLTDDPKLAKLAINTLKESKASDISHSDIANYLVNQKPDPSATSPKKVIDHLEKELRAPTASDDEMETWVKKAIKDNPGLVKKYQSGKTSVIGAFIGDVMKQSQGQADPNVVRELLKKKLGQQ